VIQAFASARQTPLPIKRALLAIAIMILCGNGSACSEQTQVPRGDVSRGAALYQQRCGACHSLDADRVGPRHRGVFGRRAASVEGYQYSDALRQLNATWDAETLDRWLADPTAMAPGTAMGVSTPGAQDRADIIAYLNSDAAR
jgi:cytochrome c